MQSITQAVEMNANFKLILSLPMRVQFLYEIILGG